MSPCNRNIHSNRTELADKLVSQARDSAAAYQSKALQGIVRKAAGRPVWPQEATGRGILDQHCHGADAEGIVRISRLHKAVAQEQLCVGLAAV